MTPETVLVTGAHGFLGRHVARRFHRAGAYVIGLGHGAWAEAEWRSWGLAEWHAADVTAANLRLGSRRPDVLVHCAGSGSPAFSVREPQADFARTVQTTVEVLAFLRAQAPAARLVYPSSGAVYGPAEILPVPENAPLRPVAPYGRHKAMAEELCRTHGRRFGGAAAVVRLFSVYGPGLRKQLLWDACEKLGRGGAVFHGTGAEERDWLHVEDASELLAVAAGRASAECPVVNGGTGRGVSVREIVGALAQGASFSFSEEPDRAGVSRMVADIVAARAWGWAPRRDWREGIEEYRRWYREARVEVASRPDGTIVAGA